MKLEYICVGRIVNAHGIRGEVRVLPHRVPPEFLTACRRFYIDGAPVTPTAVHVHKGAVLVKLPGVDDRNAALERKGTELLIRREDANLPAGQYFDDELIGLEVYDCDTLALLGTLTEVETYPAGKVYTVKGAEREYLVPAVPEAFIRSVDIEQNRMEIKVWEGL
ncbi:MAG: 16S rRNA processing protein RimM [Oscillibacter sp.]|nr:16S rRNA processing protein RimM [Oscillibacter sp.]